MTTSEITTANAENTARSGGSRQDLGQSPNGSASHVGGKPLTPAEQRMMANLKKYGRILAQFEDGSCLYGFDCGPRAHSVTFKNLVKKGRIRATEFGLDGVPMTYGAA